MIKVKRLPPGLYSLLEKASIPFFGLASFFIVVRAFEQSEFGVWTLFISVSALLESVHNAFILTPFVKYYHTVSKAERKHIVAGSLILNSCIALSIALLILLLSGRIATIFDASSLAGILEMHILHLPLIVGVIQLNAFFHANGAFNNSFKLSFVRRCTFFLYVLYSLLPGRDITMDSLVVAQIISSILSLILFSKILIGLLRTVYSGWREWITTLFNYGKYTVSTNLTSVLFKNTDTWMLGVLLSPVSVALYNPAIRISGLIEVPTGALASYIYPKLSKLSTENQVKNFSATLERTIAVNLAVYLPVILVLSFTASFVIDMLVGSNYAESASVLQITLLHALFIPIERHLGIAFNALGKPTFNFYLAVLRTIINVAMNYLLISAYGIDGAAIATLVSYSSGAFISLLLIQQFNSVRILNILKYILFFFLNPVTALKQI